MTEDRSGKRLVVFAIIIFVIWFSILGLYIFMNNQIQNECQDLGHDSGSWEIFSESYCYSTIKFPIINGIIEKREEGR